MRSSLLEGPLSGYLGIVFVLNRSRKNLDAEVKFLSVFRLILLEFG